MPCETRYVIFSRAELISAVRQYFAKTGRSLPVGHARKVELAIEVGITATIEIVEDRNDRVHVIFVDTDQIISALILYCKDQKIPLPLHSNKLLQMVGTNICLFISKNMPTVTGAGARLLQVA